MRYKQIIMKFVFIVRSSVYIKHSRCASVLSNMDNIRYILAIIVLSLHNKLVLGNVAPDYIHVCPGMKSDCLKKTIQETIPKFVKGIPEFGIVPLDPLHQDVINLVLPGGFKIGFNNGSVFGIRNCIIDSVNYEFKNPAADLSLHCNLTIKGKYKAYGRILIININGEGDAKIKATNVVLKCKIKFEDAVRDGIVYEQIKQVNVRHIFKDRVTFDLSNLFKGNPEISEAVLNFLNANWKQVAEEFGDPVVETVAEHVKDNIKKFFNSIPKNELIIPE